MIGTSLPRIETQAKFDLEPLRRLVKEKVLSGAAERDRGDIFAMDIYQALHEAGWFLAFVPEELGGMGASTIDLAWIARELAYGSAGVFTSVMSNMVALTCLAMFGSAEIKERVFGEYRKRFFFSSFCWTEPNAGSDVLGITTSAREERGGYVLSGRKCFISNASYSEVLVVMAKLKGVEHPKDALRLFFVPADSKGVVRGKPLEKLGQRDSNTSELYFDEVFVPARHMLPGRGFDMAFRSLQRSKTLIAAASIGVCQRARDLVVPYLENRVLYGKPLLTQPLIRSQLVRHDVQLEAAWLMTCNAAAAWESGQMAVREASMAKLYAADIAQKYVTEVLELFGGYGFTREYEIERLYRDIRLFEILEGPSFVQEALIAKETFPRREVTEGSSIKKAA